jgi:hypothetical protein
LKHSEREGNLDALARAVAGGDLSRRQVVGKAAAVMLGVSLANPLTAFAARRRCKKGTHRCGSKCCPPGYICHTKHGHKPRCVCPPHKTSCSGHCVDLKTDAAHCGTCGQHCPPGQVCVNGKCQVHCATGQANCGGACVSLGSDAANCGACGNVCAPGDVCSNGQCTTTCEPGLVQCGAACVALASDPSNCGACGTTCAPGSRCVNGTCVADPTCSDGVQNGQETDVDCGGPNCPKCADGKKCASGSDCVSGVCSAGVCAQPPATCSDGVQNEGETDIDCGGPHCPKCADGKKCASASDCVSGVCSGGVCAAPTCSDTVQNGGETDVDCGGPNCPKCADGKKCSTGTDCASGVCNGGVCAQSCVGTISCGIGACARVVPCNETCVPGSPSPEVCNGIDDNCNGQVDDGDICPPISHGNYSCSGGNCVLAFCDAGWADCNKDPADGCETDLSGSLNCGACGNDCSNQAAGHACVNGKCGCNNASDCSSTAWCNSGTCNPKKSSGATCSSNVECVSNNCAVGVCA